MKANFVFIFITFLSLLITAINCNELKSNFESNNTVIEESFCLSQTCVKEAARIIRSLDESVSPCDDFYQFACGNWFVSTPIPDQKSSVNSFNQLQDVVNHRIKSLLENIDSNNETKEFVLKVNDYYKSCMNTNMINSLGNKPLLDLLRQLTAADDWPLYTSANTSDIHWTDLYQRLREFGLTNNVLFSLSVSTDIRNNSRKILTLDQPSYGLSRESLLKEDTDLAFVAYRDLMIKSGAKLANNGSEVKLIAETVDAIIEFETRLANISMSKEERRNLTFILYETNDDLNDVSLDYSMNREERDYLKSVYNRITIKQLKQISPNIDWSKIVDKYMTDESRESDEIILNDTSFIRRLDQLLSQTNNRLIVNYMVWRIIQSKQLSLSKDWIHMRHEFEFVLKGTKKAKPRWHQCIKAVESGLQLVVSHLYVKHFFSPVVKQKATELIENVRQEFKKTLIQIDWIDDQTKARALDKLDKMEIMVAYPEQMLNETEISLLYETLSFNSSDFFGNILKVNQWKYNISYHSLRKANHINDWRRVGSLIRSNAFYNTVKNMVIIPAGILHGVFYNKDRPNYLNYGAIAKTAAHEIIHGFDNNGRHFDGEGNFNYWWDANSDQKYRNKAKCFVRQYGEYFVQHVGLNVNGMRTQGENIADNGGIGLAFRAYQNHVRQYGPELRLPALDYTPDQLFWISYGVHYCAKHNRESLMNLMINDSHTPKKYRINGALSNSVDFSKSFNCSLGAPMNPKHKCFLW